MDGILEVKESGPVGVVKKKSHGIRKAGNYIKNGVVMIDWISRGKLPGSVVTLIHTMVEARCL